MRPDWPFSPAKCPVFYGWIVLFWSAIGVIMSLPGQTMGVGVFTDDLMKAGGFSRLELSTAYMIGTILSSFMLPRAGRWYDRFGARRMTPAVSVCLALVLCLLPFLSTVRNFSVRFASDSLRFLFPFVFITVCFIALRFFGQGTLTMVSKNMALKWFVRRKGLANGILGIAISFGFSLGVVGLNLLVTQYGWEETLSFLAVAIGVLFSILSYIFYRDSPQESGLLPDGSSTSDEKRKDNSSGRDSTLQEAKITFVFWWFTFGLALIALLHTAISFHIISLFAEAGIHRDEAVKLFFHMAIVGALVTMFAGWLSDHIALHHILMVMAAGMCLTCFVLLDLGSPVARFALAIGMGIGQGCFGILSSVTWPHFFGLTHLGAITGLVMSFIVFGSALGPPLYGFAEHIFGDYLYAHLLCLAASIALFVGSPRAVLKR